jgi:cob(I)alamin adenosyltransferase
MNIQEFNIKKWFDMAFRIFSIDLFPFTNNHLSIKTEPCKDIEDAHLESCRGNNMFYTDPSTSLAVLTEVAQLKRGKCCGNMCRHCPYGWDRVRSLSKLSLVEVHEKCVSDRSGMGGCESGIGRRVGEFVKSGDKRQCESELAIWKSRKITSSPDMDGLNSSVPFTKGGDKGTSTLSNGERLSKGSDCFTVIGSVDELCSFVGVAHSMIIDRTEDVTPHIRDIETLLFDIIQRLFDIGGVIATRGNSVPVGDLPSCSVGDFKKSPQMTFPSSNTDELETYITKQTTTVLPILTNFILPTGSPLSSHLHVCRSVCRRVERDYIRYLESRNSTKFEPDSISVYLNRLSDFLFTASRVVNLFDKKGRGDVKFVGTGEGGLKRSVQ